MCYTKKITGKSCTFVSQLKEAIFFIVLMNVFKLFDGMSFYECVFFEMMFREIDVKILLHEKSAVEKSAVQKKWMNKNWMNKNRLFENWPHKHLLIKNRRS